MHNDAAADKFVFTDPAEPPATLECRKFYSRVWSGEVDLEYYDDTDSAEDCLSLCKSKHKQIFQFYWTTPQYDNVNVKKTCHCNSKDIGDKVEMITGETSCSGKLHNLSEG